MVRFNGDPGPSPPDIFLAGGALASFCDPTLAERPWLALLDSILAFLAAIIPLADCPLPTGCGRGRTGESNVGVFLKEDTEACCCSFDGELGLKGGENVLVLASLGEFILDDEDTTELGLGGGKCGTDSRSGVPLA